MTSYRDLSEFVCMRWKTAIPYSSRNGPLYLTPPANGIRLQTAEFPGNVTSYQLQSKQISTKNVASNAPRKCPWISLLATALYSFYFEHMHIFPRQSDIRLCSASASLKSILTYLKSRILLRFFLASRTQELIIHTFKVMRLTKVMKSKRLSLLSLRFASQAINNLRPLDFAYAARFLSSCISGEHSNSQGK